MPKHLPLADPAGEYATPLPPAVKAAAAAAEALHAQHYGKTPPPAAADGTIVLTPPTETPVPAPTAPPVAVTPTPSPDQVITPAPAPAPSEPVADATVSERAYRGMKGRFDRATAENLQLKDHIRDLQAAVDTLKRAQETAPKTPLAELTPEDINEYGPDMVAMVQRVAAAQNKELLSTITELKSQLGKVADTTVKTTREACIRELTSLVPDWAQLDTDQDFLQWLALPDEFSGAIRHDLLAAAYEQNNAPRVAKFFQGFLATRLPQVPPGQPGASPPAPKPPATPALELDTLAAPGRAKSTASASAVPVEKPIISRADIVAFYAAKQRGQYTPAQIQEYETELWQAQRDGRIRN